MLSPFRRLARTHALMTAGDVAMVVSLAGSLFFSISPDAARSKVLLYLLVSFAPFAVVAPLIGPFIDKAPGGRRLIIQLTAVGRALLFADDDLPSRRSAAVPAVVRRDDPAEDLWRLAVGADPDGGQQQDRTGRGQLEARPDLGCHRRARRSVRQAALAAISPKLSLLFGIVMFGLAVIAASKLPKGAVAPSAAARRADGAAQRIAALGGGGDEHDPCRHRLPVLRAAVLAAGEPLQQRVDRCGDRRVDRRVDDRQWSGVSRCAGGCARS